MWRFQLTDDFGVPKAELLNLYDRNVTIALSKLDSLTFRVRLDHPQAADLFSLHGLIKGYWNNTLDYVGVILSAEENGSQQGSNLAITSTGVGWELQKRLVGRSATGTVYASNDRADIATNLLAIVNGEAKTRISNDVDLVVPTGSIISYVAGPYKPYMECLTELANAADGFDWRFQPIEPTGGVPVLAWNQPPKVAKLAINPAWGIVQPDAIFEFGTGRANLTSYKIMRDRTGQGNILYHHTSNGPDAPGFPTVWEQDIESTATWGLLQDVVSADLIDPGLRSSLLLDQLTMRANPRTLITYEPALNVGRVGMPEYIQDYRVGDFVRARAIADNQPRFDAFFRVWGVTFSQDEKGAAEKISLTLEENDA